MGSIRYALAKNKMNVAINPIFRPSFFDGFGLIEHKLRICWSKQNRKNWMPKSKSKDIKISSTFLPSSTFKYVCYIVKPIVFKHVSKYNNPSKAIIGCRYLLFKADQLRRSSLNESTQLSNTINVASINRNSLNRSMSIQQVDSQKIPQFFFP